MWDLIINNGEIVDGSGLPAYQADVAIVGEQIAAIGRNLGTAAQTINAEGLTIIPGIIDAHSHADLIVPLASSRQAELLRGKLLQGVTTIVVGNCGLGVAPILNQPAENILRGINAWMTPDTMEWQWHTVTDYLDLLAKQKLVLNVGMLIPHGPVRIGVMGLSKDSPTTAQLRQMQSLVKEAMIAGALGLSTGLIYPPGMYAAPDEFIALAKVVAKANGIYTSHIRGSSNTLLPAVKELIDIGRQTGVRVHHSHNEAVGRRHWPQINHVLEMEEEAVDEGIALSFDMFPYTVAATMMIAIYPPWALEGGVNALVERLKELPTRRRIARDLMRTPSRWASWAGRGWPHNLVRAVGWEKICIGYVAGHNHKEYIGLSLAELATAVGKEPFDAISDLIIAEQGRVSMLIHEISGDEQQQEFLTKYIRHPLSAFCTDAEDYGHGHPHPAAYGAFTRILSHFVVNKRVISFEQAIRKMTSYPAQLFGIKDRGLVRAGMVADLALINRGQLADRATLTSPRRTANGLAYLLLNGQIAIEQGLYKNSYGKVIRKQI